MLPHKIYPWAGILPYAMPVHLTYRSRHRSMLCVALSLYLVAAVTLWVSQFDSGKGGDNKKGARWQEQKKAQPKR